MNYVNKINNKLCFIQLTLLCVTIAASTTSVAGDLPPGTRARANTYLPPDTTKGYDYNKPSPGFPSPGPPGRPSFPTGPPARPPARPPTGPPARPPSPPGGGYPAPGPRPTPGFPDYSGSPSGPGGTVSCLLLSITTKSNFITNV